MVKTLFSMIPNPENLLALEPEELAGVVLEWWNSLPEEPPLNRHNFGLSHTVREYPYEYHNSLLRALMEAWAWIEREGLIAPSPFQDGWYFLTKRGKQITSKDSLDVYRRADMLPKGRLHPVIAQKVWATFLRGDYDVAVFQAFKEVEVKVRSEGRFTPQDLGTDLMRKAFNVAGGPLTNPNALKSEQQATSDLFAGAIGLFKNPHSHRNVQIDATEATEMIMLASLLLKMVDAGT